MGAAWPANAVLFVYVSAGMDSLRNTVTMWPSLQAVNDEFRGYCFAVPGVIFWLWLGALPYDMLAPTVPLLLASMFTSLMNSTYTLSLHDALPI